MTHFGMSARPKLGLFVCLLLLLTMGYYFFGLLIPRSHAALAAKNLNGGYGYGNDLYQIWFTTRTVLAHRVDPFSPAIERQIETGLYGRPLDRRNPTDRSIPYRGFCYPLYADIVALPLSLLPFPAVQVVLSCVLPVAVWIAVACWCAALGLTISRVNLLSLVLITLAAFPVLEGVYALQPTLIVAALVAAATAALGRDQFVRAGILLALATIKPQLSFLPMLGLLVWTLADWQPRKKLLIAFCLSFGFLLLASEIWLPHWWLGWIHNLSAYRQTNSPPLAQLVLGRALGRAVSVVLVGLALVAVVRWRRCSASAPRFYLLLAYLLATSVVAISSSIASYDQMLLLPAILWLWVNRQSILRANRALRLVALLAIATLCWQWIIGPILAVASFLFPVARSSQAIVLPLVTAASFPLILIALLATSVWQAVRAGGTLADYSLVRESTQVS
jgi:Glycosyltransferase family 87